MHPRSDSHGIIVVNKHSMMCSLLECSVAPVYTRYINVLALRVVPQHCTLVPVRYSRQPGTVPVLLIKGETVYTRYINWFFRKLWNEKRHTVRVSVFDSNVLTSGLHREEYDTRPVTELNKATLD
jgi:hypothetical protein